MPRERERMDRKYNCVVRRRFNIYPSNNDLRIAALCGMLANVCVWETQHIGRIWWPEETNVWIVSMLTPGSNIWRARERQRDMGVSQVCRFNEVSPPPPPP